MNNVNSIFKVEQSYSLNSYECDGVILISIVIILSLIFYYLL